jgi:hypothetical protein
MELVATLAEQRSAPAYVRSSQNMHVHGEESGMIVKINGNVVQEERKAIWEDEVVPLAAKSKWAVPCGVAAAVAAGLLVGDASIAHAAGAATAAAGSGFSIERAMIGSVKYNFMLLGVLFLFKREWCKTGAVASGIVYGTFFCGDAIASLVALIGAWVNHGLQHYLDAYMGA